MKFHHIPLVFIVLVITLIVSIKCASADVTITVPQDSRTPTTVWTSEGVYIVIPDYTDGGVEAVVTVSEATSDSD